MKRYLKSSGFFVELIITIVFFAIASCIIVQIFARSALLSEEASNRAMAAEKVQSLCETVKAVGLSGISDVAEVQGKVVTFGYDANWQSEAVADAVFTIILTTTEEAKPAGQLRHLDFKAQKGRASLFEMQAAVYESQRGEVQ